MDNEGLFELKEQLNVDEEEVTESPKHLISKVLNEIIQKENDLIQFRSSKVAQNVLD